MQALDDRRQAAATSKKRKEVARGGEASPSSEPPPKRRVAPQRRAVPQLSAEQEAARLAAARAAGVAVAQRGARTAECERTRSLLEAAQQEAAAASERAARLEGQMAAQVRETAEACAGAADRVALLRLETAKQARELQAVVDEYVSLKASMQRMRAGFASRMGRAMRARDETPAYQMPHDRRAELFRLFPGRPWADHVDYQRLEAGDTTVGCALPPMPAMPPNAVANMSGGV